MSKKPLHSIGKKLKLVKLAQKSVEVEVIADVIIQPIEKYIDSLHLPYFLGKENMKEDWKKSIELAYKLGQISMGQKVKSIDGIELKDK
jgi:hypothetical protein